MIAEAMTSTRDDLGSRIDHMPMRRALRTVLATVALTAAIALAALLSVR
jgi:hypothetical protein